MIREAKRQFDYFIPSDSLQCRLTPSQFPERLPTWAGHRRFFLEAFTELSFVPLALLRVDMRNGLMKNVPAL